MQFSFGGWEEFHPGTHRMERNTRRGLIRKHALSEEAEDRKALVIEGAIQDTLLGQVKPRVRVSTGHPAHITMPDIGAPMDPFDPQKAAEALREAAHAADWSETLSESLLAPRHTLLPNLIKARVERLVTDGSARDRLIDLLPTPLAHGDRSATTLSTFEPHPSDLVMDQQGTVRVVDWDSPVIGPPDVSLISLGAVLRVEGRNGDADAIEEGVEDPSLIPWVSRCRLVLLAARAWATADYEAHLRVQEALEEGRGMGGA